MTKELLLMRHGKSAWRVASDDFHRPLKKRGKREARKMGVWLREQNLLPDLILSSPAERAISTAEKLSETMLMEVRQIHRDERIYLADCKMLKEVLGECAASVKRVLLVGHNPELEQLLFYLAADDIKLPDDGKLLATATLAMLKIPSQWDNLRQGCAELLFVTRASSLPPI